MTDHDYMQIAISEAKKGTGLTSPNPTVGAVIVKNDHIIGTGWHRKAGCPHAEREAIADAISKHGPESLADSTIYITLEPCSTQGRTPACVSGIIEAGISTVIYGARDPNPAHAGAADSLLQDHAINVISGVESEACEALIQTFTKRISTGLPWVIAKTAVSLDGRITRPQHEGQWLTGPAARAEVHKIRASVDAIISGGKTVRRDNPSLTIRGEAYRAEKPQPWRVILTQSGKSSLPQDANIFTDEHAERTIIHQDLSLTESLRKLADMGCNSVMLECGGVLMRQYLDLGLIDELALFIAPLLVGGPDHGFGIGEHLKSSQFLNNASSQMLGDDFLIRGNLDKSTQ